MGSNPVGDATCPLKGKFGLVHGNVAVSEAPPATRGCNNVRGLLGVEKHPISGVYRVRHPVPPHLHEIVGQKVFTRTLGTKLPEEARPRAPAVLAKYWKLTDDIQVRFEAELADYRRRAAEAEQRLADYRRGVGETLALQEERGAKAAGLAVPEADLAANTVAANDDAASEMAAA